MKKKPQIVFIHGGMTFKNRRDYLHYLKTRDIPLKKKKRWHGVYVDKMLSSQCDIIRPSMPLAENAHYEDWKVHFKRYIPRLRHGVILVGGSLGGIFLAKYLSENTFPKRIRSVYLVAPPFDNSLTTEDLVGGFSLPRNLSRLEKQVPRLVLMFSKNDRVVPPAHAVKYAKKLTRAEINIYKHIKGHFQVERFPQIVQMIRKDIKR